MASVLTVALALGSLLPSSARGQDSLPKAPAGIFSDEQAERGNGVFTRVCLECHTRNDMTNADFRMAWNGRTVFELFEIIRTTMPDGAPGTMTREEYADVTAYLLKINGMPAGSAPMPGDSTLSAHKIDIPAPPPLSMRPVTSRALHGVQGARPSRLVPSLSSFVYPIRTTPLRRGS
ncbi:MAG TPA: c-type cytochrome [Gemmatimonas sp.]|nr:c-type cytochrome [Gemmatimonas sp.]